jgi:hypothetical protein
MLVGKRRNYSTFVLFILQPDSGHKDSKTRNCVDCMVRTELPLFFIIVELPYLLLLKFAILLSLIF